MGRPQAATAAPGPRRSRPHATSRHGRRRLMRPWRRRHHGCRHRPLWCPPGMPRPCVTTQQTDTQTGSLTPLAPPCAAFQAHARTGVLRPRMTVTRNPTQTCQLRGISLYPTHNSKSKSLHQCQVQQHTAPPDPPDSAQRCAVLLRPAAALGQGRRQSRPHRRRVRRQAGSLLRGGGDDGAGLRLTPRRRLQSSL